MIAGRKKTKSSKLSFMNLGLTKEEDEKFIALLKQQDLSGRQLIRALIKEWIRNNGVGILRYAKN